MEEMERIIGARENPRARLLHRLLNVQRANRQSALSGFQLIREVN